MNDDVAADVLRAAVIGDTADAFRIITDHLRQADDPRQTMFVIAAGYAAVAADADFGLLDGLGEDEADVVRTLVVAVRSDDLVGGWLLWGTVSAGVCGSVLGGLLAVAARSARRAAGL